MSNEKKQQQKLWLSEKARGQLAALASAFGLSRSALVETLLAEETARADAAKSA